VHAAAAQKEHINCSKRTRQHKARRACYAALCLRSCSPTLPIAGLMLPNVQADRHSGYAGALTLHATARHSTAQHRLRVQHGDSHAGQPNAATSTWSVLATFNGDPSLPVLTNMRGVAAGLAAAAVLHTCVGLRRSVVVCCLTPAPSPLLTAAHRSSCAGPGSRMTALQPSVPLQQ
jgi:hypothetical protein